MKKIVFDITYENILVFDLKDFLRLFICKKYSLNYFEWRLYRIEFLKENNSQFKEDYSSNPKSHTFGQIYDFANDILQCIDIELTGRYNNYTYKFNCFDSTLWEIETNDDEFIDVLIKITL